MTLPAFAAYSGSRQPKILLVGEAWGSNERDLRLPFVGSSGKELWLMLGEAMPELVPELHLHAASLHRYGLAWVRDREPWLQAAAIGMTNVLNLQPPANKMAELAYSLKDARQEDTKYDLPALGTGPLAGKYLRCEFLPELDRLRQEILQTKPNLIVALGNTACWALLKTTAISSIRGSITSATAIVPNSKVLPAYHPAGVLYNWSWRPILVADLIKAGREGGFPEIRRPVRQVLVNPTLPEVSQWTGECLANNGQLLACDIETGARQIKCIGFASSRDNAIVVPFVDLTRPGGSYWSSEMEERAAWQHVQQLLESDLPKVFQNGMYDLQYLMRMGFRPRQLLHDTMLLHHSLFPEMRKSLGFLGSIYTNESSWKLMNRPKADSVKRDE